MVNLFNMTTASVKIEEWSLDKVLGSGGFGIVELWVHKSGKQLAIKICKKDTAQLTEAQKKRWMNEVQIMKRLNHPNIIKGLELPFKHPEDKIDVPVSCMEFCRRGDLRKVLNKVENCCGVSEIEAINVMKNISSAVEYLHSNNITHRDLKPENIVLQDIKEHDTVYKLIDLGYAKELGEASTSGSLVGTLNYVAPELLWKQTYSCSVDYWSLGILFYELVTGTRPFLPGMQHTMSWMQHIRNKGYNDICAFKSDGKIVFGQDISRPTNLSKNLQNKLVEWFRVVLQWDPKRRGKQFDKEGILKLVVFKMLHSILSKQIIHVFSMSTYKLDAYEVDHTTTITDLQHMIAENTNIPINQQILTDYFGKILVENQKLLLSQIQRKQTMSQQDPVLFVFKNESSLMKHIPIPDIPMEIQKMIQFSRWQLDLETLKDYYRATMFFIKQGTYLFQLYIFALTIKADMVISRLNMFDENITNVLTDINTHSSELPRIFAKCKTEHINAEKVLALKTNHEKVNKLAEVTHKIKLKFNLLTQESKKLSNAVQPLDCISDMYQIYDKAAQIYKSCNNEHSHKGGIPTEMVKVIFEFWKIQEVQLNNTNILEIMKQIIKLEAELQTLESIFNSVIAMSRVYREEFENIKHNIFYDGSAIRENTKILPNDNKQMLNEFNSNHFSSASNITANKECVLEIKDDVIYDNLVIRCTLDSVLQEMQKKYIEFLSLDP